MALGPDETFVFEGDPAECDSLLTAWLVASGHAPTSDTSQQALLDSYVARIRARNDRMEAATKAYTPGG